MKYIKSKLNINSSTWEWILYVIAILAMAAPICMMNIHLIGSPRLFEAIANALLIALPFAFVPSRFRWTLLIPVWGVALFFVANICYWRFFENMIPMSDFFLFENFDSTTFGAGLDMLKPKVDIFLILPAIVVTLIYLYLYIFKRTLTQSNFNRKQKLLLTISTILIFCFSELYSQSRINSSNLFESLADRYAFESKIVPESNPWVEYCTTGLVTYTTKGILKTIVMSNPNQELTDEEKHSINQFGELHAKLALNDTTRLVSTNKNLIFIVVESLNSWVVDYTINNKPIMPTLQKLRESKGTLFANNVLSQVQSGVSSDGQLIYNTGLYPASDATTVSRYGTNDFPSLSKILKKHKSFEVMCEPILVWNHKTTNKSFGYNFYKDNSNYKAKTENIGRDEALFKTAFEVIDTVSKPFFAFITTISMHAPFKDQNVKTPQWIANAPNLTEGMKNYLTVCNYFDSQLNIFLNNLKKRNLYDNSIIVIASDHSAPVEGVGITDFITFMALNTPFQTQTIDRVVGQVDVFPTILDIMGVKSDYRGMGLSIFNPNNTMAIDKRGGIHTNNNTTNPSLDSLLRLSRKAANAMHKGNLYIKNK